MHAIISTHTARHLRRTLLGVLAQSVPVSTITVTCDTDTADISDVVARLVDESGACILLVQRPHQGESRSSQVRNNAVRALLARARPPNASDLLWFLDGDCIPAPDCLAQLSFLAARPTPTLAVAFRIDLTPEQTDALTDDAVRAGRAQGFITPTDDQLATLARRHSRYQRHALMRRLGLGKPHKPKLLSANFGVTLRDYLAVNGFDETYTGYGQEDDDLGRRLYAIGVRPAIGVASARAFHQYHPTRAPQAWEASPNAARFAAPFTPRCIHGVTDPAPQPDPTTRLVAPSGTPSPAAR